MTNINIPWAVIFKTKQNIVSDIKIMIEEHNKIWWNVNFFYKYLNMTAPIKKPIALQKNRNEY